MCSWRDGEEVGESAVEECGVEIECITSDQYIRIQQHHALEIAAIQLAAVEDRGRAHSHIVNQRLIVTRNSVATNALKLSSSTICGSVKSGPSSELCATITSTDGRIGRSRAACQRIRDEGAVDLGP